MAAVASARLSGGLIHPERQNLHAPRPQRTTVQPIKSTIKPNNPSKPKFGSIDEIAETATRVLAHIGENLEADGIVVGFIENVRRYALNAQRGDVAGMERVLNMLNQISKDTAKLSERVKHIETTTSSSYLSSVSSAADRWRGFRLGNWRDTVGAISPNPTSGRSHGTSSPGIPECERRGDNEVIVTLTGAERTALRSKKLVDIVEDIENLRVKLAIGQASGALTGSVRVEAARRLQSGDIVVIANTAAGAEVLRKRTGWEKALGKDARIQRPTWGVVARDLPLNEFGLESPGEVAAELVRQNVAIWGISAEISHVGWLVKPRQQSPRKAASVVIEFTNPVHANQAITQGLRWQRGAYSVVRFCREGRMKHCAKCQKFGHVLPHCQSKTSVCGYCSKNHSTWECDQKDSNPVAQCANCGEGHRPSSSECIHKRKAMEEAALAIAKSPLFHYASSFHQQQAEQADQTKDLTQSIHAPLANPATKPMAKPKAKPVTKQVAKPVAKPTTKPVMKPMAKPITNLPADAAEPSQRSHGRPKGSQNKSKASTTGEDDNLPLTQDGAGASTLAVATRTSRSQPERQTQEIQLYTDPETLLRQSKKPRFTAPDDVMEEETDELRWPDQIIQDQTNQDHSDQDFPPLPLTKPERSIWSIPRSSPPRMPWLQRLSQSERDKQPAEQPTEHPVPTDEPEEFFETSQYSDSDLDPSYQ
ncbi:zinc knuckle domain protein [Penicillium herquei]|nr:zinc knuckle domain protein [Penicillium herquei]